MISAKFYEDICAMEKTGKHFEKMLMGSNKDNVNKWSLLCKQHTVYMVRYTLNIYSKVIFPFRCQN